AGGHGLAERLSAIGPYHGDGAAGFGGAAHHDASAGFGGIDDVVGGDAVDDRCLRRGGVAGGRGLVTTATATAASRGGKADRADAGDDRARVGGAGSGRAAFSGTGGAGRCGCTRLGGRRGGLGGQRAVVHDRAAIG